MKRLSLFSLLAAALIFSLSSCGNYSVTNSAKFSAALSPSPLEIDYTVNVDKNTGALINYTAKFTQSTITFQSYPGALGASVESADIAYFDVNGDPLFKSHDGLEGVSIGVQVPPGIRCGESDPTLCTVNSQDASLDFGVPVTSNAVSFVSYEATAAYFSQLYNGNVKTGEKRSVGSAKIYYHGLDSRSIPFKTDAYPQAVSAVIVAVKQGDSGSGGSCSTLTARDDSTSTTVNTPVTIDVLADDCSPSGNLTLVSVSPPPVYGTATISNGEIVYTPQTNYTGTDIFRYTVTDGNNNYASAYVNVTVQ